MSKWRWLSNPWTLEAVALAGLLVQPIAAHADNKTVVTENGPVRGIVSDDERAFLGIPYAEPPVGDLRWRPPVPVSGHHGLMQATQLANHCAQPTTPFGLPSQDEDCLYLNVYTPGDGDKHANSPVMVWIHPGAFQYGESDDFEPHDLLQ